MNKHKSKLYDIVAWTTEKALTVCKDCMEEWAETANIDLKNPYDRERVNINPVFGYNETKWKNPPSCYGCGVELWE